MKVIQIAVYAVCLGIIAAVGAVRMRMEHEVEGGRIGCLTAILPYIGAALVLTVLQIPMQKGYRGDALDVFMHIVTGFVVVFNLGIIEIVREFADCFLEGVLYIVGLLFGPDMIFACMFYLVYGATAQ